MPIPKKLSLIYCLLLIFICKTWGYSTYLHAQPKTPFFNSTLERTGQYRDTLRALIVFTKFKDDKYPGDPQVHHREWPLFEDPRTLPSPATALLSKTPYPPFPDSSLTAYFYEQSLGHFVLYGQPYDSVLVTLHNESRYHQPNGGYGELTKELLDKIDTYGFDFSKYDHNRDGFIDYVFIVLRGDSQRDRKTFAWTGASCLDGRCTGSMLVNSSSMPPPSYDGKIVDWNKSGSYIMHRTPGNVSAFHYYIRLMAHEIGHDIWGHHFVHIPDYRRNDVPLTHNRGKNKDCVGYVLMAGAGGAWDCGGSETISAFERDLLGWIECAPLSESTPNVIIGDLFTTSSCVKIGLSQPYTSLYLSNLQHISYFDQQRAVGNKKQFQIGLRTSGLLIHLANGKRVDVIPADNDLMLSSTHQAYEMDLFGPKTAKQITPWTKPNSNGFTNYPMNFQPDWIAVDNIRELDEPGKPIALDFYKDFRDHPIIREDSWIGPETEGHAFSAPIKVVDLSTLHLDTAISLDRGMSIQTGSTVIIGSNASMIVKQGTVLTLHHGSTLHIEGELILDGLLAKSPGARIIIGEQSIFRSKSSYESTYSPSN